MADDHLSLSSGPCRSTAVSSASAALRPPPEQVKCPRCESPNTKFCYYNNYSLSQPRHFCKSCRRYWTKGGALRNVPVGGGCRKNKKSKSSSALATGASSGQKFLNSLPATLAGDLHHVGMLPFTRLHPPAPPTIFDGGDHFFSSSSTPSSVAVSDSMFSSNYHPISAVGVQNDHMSTGGGSSSAIDGGSKQSSLISSIESLSSINQDLHLKLQQQRLVAFFGGSKAEANQLEGQQAAASSCHVLQRSRLDGGEAAYTSQAAAAKASGAWFLDSTCTAEGMTSIINPISENINNDSTTSNWNEISGWTDHMHQFT